MANRSSVIPTAGRLSLATLPALLLGVFLLAACQVVAPPPPRVAPLMADAGADVQVRVGDSPNFDACSSTGPIANYRWTVLQAPDGMPDYAGKEIMAVQPRCSFTLEASMLVEEVGRWVIQLEVRDHVGNISTDTVVIEVIPA